MENIDIKFPQVRSDALKDVLNGCVAHNLNGGQIEADGIASTLELTIGCFGKCIVQCNSVTFFFSGKYSKTFSIISVGRLCIVIDVQK